MYTHSRPIPQREHKKSTNGCLSCKQRKIKCDEKRPVCGKCYIHFSNIQSCEYRPKSTRRSGSSKRKVAPLSSYKAAPNKTDEIDAYNALHSLLNSQEQLLLAVESQASVTRSHSRLVCPKTKQCNCPCHIPEFTSILLDAIFGICRLCGNLPSSGYPVTSCTPVIPSTVLMRTQIDPFHVLPAGSSPQVNSLIYHWINTLALFPTKIHSEYCTNPTWLATAIANPALFHATLYVSSVHIDGLNGRGQSAESLSYKCKTIKVLNEVLRDPSKATSDETISAVLLLGNILSIIGEAEEVTAHLSGLQRMISLRGGINKFSIDGCFLHMLCTTNHLSAVLSESLPLIPPTGITYTSSKFNPSTRSNPSSSSISSRFSNSSPDTPSPSWQESPLFKPFAISCGFDATIVELFHDMGYLCAVLDAFTTKLLPFLRTSFEEICESVKKSVMEYEDSNPESACA